jgi:hypothetical protein
MRLVGEHPQARKLNLNTCHEISAARIQGRGALRRVIHGSSENPGDVSRAEVGR